MQAQTISQRMKAIPAEHYPAFRLEVIAQTGYSFATYHNVYHGKSQPRYDTHISGIIHIVHISNR